jgi:hypothetical protein
MVAYIFTHLSSKYGCGAWHVSKMWGVKRGCIFNKNVKFEYLKAGVNRKKYFVLKRIM